MQHMMAAMLPMMLMFWAVFIVILVIPFWQIFKKAGLGAALSLLMWIPLVNLIMLYVLAFSRWKVVPAQETILYPPPPNYPPAA